MGTSLRVTPAADMPKMTGLSKNGNLVICNLQKTPLDNLATLCIYGKGDKKEKKTYDHTVKAQACMQCECW